LVYAFPQYLKDGTAEEIITERLKFFDVLGLCEKSEEINLERLAYIFSYFQTYAKIKPPDSPALREKMKIYSNPYYLYCLNNWKKIQPEKIVHFNNLSIIDGVTDLEKLDLFVRLHVDMEWRSRDAVRHIFVFGSKKGSTLDKLLSVCLGALRNMIHPVNHVLEGGCKIDKKYGECLSLYLLSTIFGLATSEKNTSFHPERHAKILEKASAMFSFLLGNKSEIYSQCKEQCELLLEKYKRLVSPD
jgi:hypothetical protein